MRKYKKKMELAMTLLILAGSFYIGRYSAHAIEAGNLHAAERNGTYVGTKGVVVIDAGHGGFDSGKVGVGGVLEKDINLSIAQKLRDLLKEEGVTVVMTRDGEDGLYDENESNKKQQDMKRRCALINETAPDMAVSIHQNSFTEEYVCGPQVFYYENSEAARKIAAILQEKLNTELDVEKQRKSKGNSTYYLLRKTSVPTVIVECGFLSNQREAEKLSEEEYQMQVARVLCEGILESL